MTFITEQFASPDLSSILIVHTTFFLAKKQHRVTYMLRHSIIKRYWRAHLERKEGDFALAENFIDPWAAQFHCNGSDKIL